ncbi:MAG: AMP-binding protein, partial [Actinomycetota bacterium]
MRHDRHPPLAEPGGVTVAQGLADRAADQPDALAVGDGERSLTFAELDLLAATTARVLLEHLGDHPQTGFRAVPVLVERSLASVVALHGLWRAGVPVAPLDAHLPPAVLAETIGRLGPPPVVVVTSADGASAVPPGLTPVLVPSHPGDGIPPQAVTPDDPAVVVFTSGSTGRSKGVVLPWAMLDDIRDGPVLAGIDADARCAVLSPLHWRGGINRVLAPSRGAFLLVVPDPVSDPVAAFALA